MGSINSQGVYEYDVTDDEIGPVLLNRQSAALTNLFTGRTNTVRVANVSERAAALADHGTPSTSNPLIVFRADAGAGRELEYTTNGTLWLTVPGGVDTGWIALTPINGWAFPITVEVRVIGGVGYLSGAIQKSSPPLNAYEVVAELPSGVAPPVIDTAIPLSLGSSSTDRHAYLTTGGEVLVYSKGANTTAWARVGGSFISS